MENNNQQQAAAAQAEEVKVENQAQEFEKINEPSQEQEPGFFGKAWDKTQEIAGSTIATVKEKPIESAVIVTAGYGAIKLAGKGLGWLIKKLCEND